MDYSFQNEYGSLLWCFKVELEERIEKRTENKEKKTENREK